MSKLIERAITNVALTVKLTEHERQQRAELCTTKAAQLEKIKDEAKESAKEYRDKMKPVLAEVRSLSTAYTTGVEDTIVPNAVRVYDLESNLTWVAYEGDRYDEREITKYEAAGLAQRPLFPDKPTDAPWQDPGIDPDVAGVIHEESRVRSKVDHTVTNLATEDDEDETDEDDDGSLG